jgi:hypothetical protein
MKHHRLGRLRWPAVFAVSYALSANAIGSASGSPRGGNIDHYAIGPDGQLTAVSTTSLTAGRPTAMAIGVQ